MSFLFSLLVPVISVWPKNIEFFFSSNTIGKYSLDIWKINFWTSPLTFWWRSNYKKLVRKEIGFYFLHTHNFLMNPKVFKMTILNFVKVTWITCFKKNFRTHYLEFNNKISKEKLSKQNFQTTWNVFSLKPFGIRFLKLNFQNTYNIFGNKFFRTIYMKCISESNFQNT